MSIVLPAEMQEFLDVLEFDRLCSRNTVVSYRRNLQQFVRWLAKNDITLNIFEITSVIIRQYISFLKQTVKGISIKQKIATLKSLYSHFSDIDEDYPVPVFPKKIKAVLNPVPSLSAEQLESLLNAVDKRENELASMPVSPRRTLRQNNCLRDKAIIALLAGTGIRVSEAAGINVSDIDWERRTILIHGKGSKDRTVYFNVPVIVNTLKRYAEWRTVQGFSHDALFLNTKDDTRLTTRSIQRMLKPYLQAAGLPLSVSPHTLRHSFATVCIENGANIKAISQLLGHARVETTVKYYLHLSSDFVRQAYSAINPFDKRTTPISEVIARHRSMVFQL